MVEVESPFQPIQLLISNRVRHYWTDGKALSTVAAKPIGASTKVVLPICCWKDQILSSNFPDLSVRVAIHTVVLGHLILFLLIYILV